jgi:tRNA (mo5U34)-methyltransferase
MVESDGSWRETKALSERDYYTVQAHRASGKSSENGVAIAYRMGMTDEEVRERIAAVPHWYHPIEVRPGIVTPGANDAQSILKLLALPEDCHGMRVLDLGARDGFFSFEMERRGADVIAVDYVAPKDSGFAVAAELLGSRVPYLHRNLYDLNAAELGSFDVVLFLGLLYHLPDPLGALRIVRNLTSRQMYLETLVLEFGGALDALPLMRFFAGASWAGDPTNYWGPNVRCVEEMLGETEFTASRIERIGDRCVFACEATASPEAAYYLHLASGRKQ